MVLGGGWWMVRGGWWGLGMGGWVIGDVVRQDVVRS